eukprot:s3042_g6.t1
MISLQNWLLPETTVILMASLQAVIFSVVFSHGLAMTVWGPLVENVHRYVSVLANVGGQCTVPHLPIGRQLEAAGQKSHAQVRCKLSDVPRHLQRFSFVSSVEQREVSRELLFTVAALAKDSATTSSFLLDFVVRAAFLPLEQDWRGRISGSGGCGSNNCFKHDFPSVRRHSKLTALQGANGYRRLMALIADARKWAAESGVDPDDCGKQGTATLRFPVFLFMCRLLQREKEAKALAEEEEEAKVLGFTDAQVKKLHSKFCFWVARSFGLDFDFNLTLTLEGFQKLCAHMNPRLTEEDVSEILAALPALKALPSISKGDEISEVMSQDEPQEEAEAPAVRKVGFPLFVRTLRL